MAAAAEAVDLLAGEESQAVDLLADQPEPAVAEPVVRAAPRAVQADVRKAEPEPIDRPARMTLTRGGQPKLGKSTEATFEKEAEWGEVMKSLPAQLVGSWESVTANLKEMLGRNAIKFLKDEAERAARGEQFDEAEFNRRALAAAEGSVADSSRAAAKAREILGEVIPKDMTTSQQAVSSLAQSAAPTALGVALGVATRSPAAAMAVAGGGGAASAVGSTYGQATAKGATHEVAARAAVIDGILEGVGEALPLSVALRPGTAAFKRVMGTIVAEAGQEGATQITQDLNAYLSYDPDITLESALQNLKVAVLAGAGGGAIYGGAGAAIQAGQTSAELRKVAQDIEATDVTAGTEQVAVDLLSPERAQMEMRTVPVAKQESVEISTPKPAAAQQDVAQQAPPAVEAPVEPAPAAQAAPGEAQAVDLIPEPQPTVEPVSEPVAEAIKFEDIPEDLVIKEEVLVEDTGDTVKVKRNAREAFTEADQKVNRYRALIDCMGRG